MSQIQEIREGETVKLSTILQPGEENLRFTVLELRDNRVLVQLVCDEFIKPTFVYLLTDIKPV